MDAQDPVLAELIVLRQAVAALTTNVAVNTQVTSTLQRSLDDVQQNAVPRREWELAREGDRKRIVDLEDGRRGDATFRRQILLGVSLAAFSALVSVVILVAGLLLGGP